MIGRFTHLIFLHLISNLKKMKKILLLFVLVPLFIFPQATKKKNKFSAEVVLNDKWQEYSKAFEYSDYEKISSFFTYPVTMNFIEKPMVINNKEELVKAYKEIRSNVQDGYLYSLMDKSRIIWVSKSLVMIDATYSRYNSNYQRIFKGRGVYMYKKVDNEWKIFSISAIPLEKKRKDYVETTPADISNLLKELEEASKLQADSNSIVNLV